ncbi:MAG: hypothetical protein GKS07_01235 [Nitrosopumilus sp.]|nr:MAG: hypothetical protein GKS07_01235 [Nitrosopumilus sp.]
MKSTQTKNKRQLLNYLVLTGLLLGSISAMSLPTVMAQSNEDVESDIGKIYDDLEEQYTAILKSYGFSEPQITEAQEKELDAKLAPLDAEYDRLFANYNDNLTAEEEFKVDELDKRYDAILKSYGFEYPELTEVQEEELDAKLAPLDEKFMELEEQHGDEYYYEFDLTAEEESQLDSLDKQYDRILQEYGFKFPELTESQEEELERKTLSLDKEYDRIFAQFDKNLSESEESELEKQLDSLDAKATSIMSEFGFVEPQLTEAQEEELEERLAPLDEQYGKIFGYDEEECDEHESDERGFDESDEFHEDVDDA